MWMCPPGYLCRRHLLGEHNELHKFLGSYVRGRNLEGYYRKGRIAVHEIAARHAELVAELRRRGYKHKSPLPDFEVRRLGFVDRKAALRDLLERCPDCTARLHSQKGAFMEKTSFALRQYIDGGDFVKILQTTIMLAQQYQWTEREIEVFACEASGCTPDEWSVLLREAGAPR